MIKDYNHIQDTLNVFAHKVIRKARANKLSSVGRSLNHILTEKGLEFWGDDYAEFVDKGVGGSISSPSGLQSAWSREGEQSKLPRFVSKMPPRIDILKWVKKKRMRLRNQPTTVRGVVTANSTGRFEKGSQESLAFLIQRSIFRHGLKPSLFFTSAFEELFKNLPPDMEKALEMDTAEFIREEFGDKVKN